MSEKKKEKMSEGEEALISFYACKGELGFLVVDLVDSEIACLPLVTHPQRASHSARVVSVLSAANLPPEKIKKIAKTRFGYKWVTFFFTALTHWTLATAEKHRYSWTAIIEPFFFQGPNVLPRCS